MCYILNHETHAAFTQETCNFFENLLCLGSSSTDTATAAPSPLPCALALDDVGCRDLEDYGIDPDGPDPMPDGNELDLALALSSRASLSIHSFIPWHQC